VYLQRIGRAALALNQEVDEVAGEIWEYLEDLPEDLPEEQRFEAADAAAKRIEDEVTAATQRRKR
jgi:hypothetical protein